MSEALQTRTEHSRSLADAEKYQALETLKEVGLLIPLDEVETFHGRVGLSEDVADWAVDPGFANGSNDSGNYNVNNRPTLYTGEKEVAVDFAQRRAAEFIRPHYDQYFEDQVASATPERKQSLIDVVNEANHAGWKKWQERGIATIDAPVPLSVEDLETPSVAFKAARLLEAATEDDERNKIWHDIAQAYRGEVHNITSADADAVVLDLNFNPSTLDETDAEKYKQALRALIIPLTEGSPVAFDDRHAAPKFAAALRALDLRVVKPEDIPALAEEAGVSESIALQLASGYNAMSLASTNPAYLASKLLESAHDISSVPINMGEEKLNLPVNFEYVQRYLRLNHIIGVKQTVNSATVGRQITAVSFLDLEKTITETGLVAERTDTQARLGAIASSVGELLTPQPKVELNRFLLRVLEDPHVKPAELVEGAKLVPGFEEIFEANAGNWEGYTLAEHTETVLRNFDESYADSIPVELLGPMRLAILAHDLGKPTAAANLQKHLQKQFNVEYAQRFFEGLGIDQRLSTLLVAMLGDGEELAFHVDVRNGGEAAERELHKFAVQTLEEVYGSDAVTEQQVNGFMELCSMLQACDGGAYTSMAITRVPGGGKYRNAPSFNTSFAQPLGFGKRTIRLRKEGDAAARTDLTPSVDTQQSRVIISRRGAGRKTPTITTE